MIETGKILQQRYRIDRQIGQGGMGAVYIATDERFGSTVAIKETLCMDDNYRKAIEREARLLNSLKHAALPRVSDHFLEENGQFLVMEYIQGEDLAHILEETGQPFPVDKVLTWADQLLDALEFLHTQSLPVIHRDIKPQNLKLTARGQVILLDFGLAKGNPTDAGVQTAAKSIFGYSRNYASLEQIQGTGTDPRSDLYSLAATLYHLATGQSPEDALTRAMAVLSHQPDPLVPASRLRAEIPAGFAGILQKALDLNAAARPSSAHEMRQMLREMENYAYLAEDVSAAATVGSIDPGLQKTRLMPGVTNQAVDRLTGAKTEVLPQYISQETAVRIEKRANETGPVHASGRGNIKRRAAVAGASLLLLIAGIAAGAYVYDPALFSPHREAGTEQKIDVPADQPATLSAETVPSTDTAAPETETETPSESVAETAEVPARTESPRAVARQSSKNSKSSTANTDADDIDVDLDDAELDGKTLQVGNVKITDGKIFTPKVFVDENGVAHGAPAPPVKPIHMPDMRYMTPAQRRRLLQQLRRKGVIPKRPSGSNIRN